jgi:hypothetical protein
LLVRAGIAAGLTDEELAADLEVSTDEIEELRAFAMKEEVDRFTGSTEETFALYVIFMSEKIAEMNELALKLRGEKAIKQGSAAVGAIRAQADFYDRIISRGEDLGLIKREEDGKDKIDMSDDELAGELQRRLESVQALRAVHQGVSLTEVTIDPPGKVKKGKTKKGGRPKKKGKTPGISKIKRKASLRTS